MKKLTPTKKILIACLALNLATAGFYAFILWTIQGKTEQVITVLGEVNENMKKDGSLRAIRASLSENKEFISQIDSFFVSKDGVADFIASLERYGKDANIEVSISSVDINEKTAKTDFKESLRIRIEGKGTWHNIFYFLSIIENLPYKIDVTQAALTLANAEETIVFDGPNRAFGAEEYWKGTFDITVFKIK